MDSPDDEKKWPVMKEILNQAYVRNDEDTTRDQGVNLANISPFTRYYGSVVYIPNERRELRVLKQDMNGNGLSGARFALFDTFTKAALYDPAYPVRYRPIVTGMTGSNGMLIFNIEGTGAAGTAYVDWNTIRGDDDDSVFWVREITAPPGYMVNDAIVQVYVGDTGVYANASAYKYEMNEDGSVTAVLIDDEIVDKDVSEYRTLQSGGTYNKDMVTVRATVGKLFQTMEKYADSILNTTLLDVDARDTLYIAKTDSREFWDPEDAANSEDWHIVGEDRTLHMHFWNDEIPYSSSDYCDDHKDPDNGIVFSTTENGYLAMNSTQTAQSVFENQHAGERRTLNSRREILYLNKTDGNGNPIPVDISGVFSPVNIIVVQDRPSSPHVSIEKEQSPSGEDERTKKTLEVADGNIVTYYLTMTSDGIDTATDVIVTDVIPVTEDIELEFVENSIRWGLLNQDGSIDWGEPSDREITGEYDETTRTITWRLGDMPVDERIIVSFQVKVPGVEEETQWINGASLTYGNNPNNPTDSDDRDVIDSNEVVIYEPVRRVLLEFPEVGGMTPIFFYVSALILFAISLLFFVGIKRRESKI